MIWYCCAALAFPLLEPNTGAQEPLRRFKGTSLDGHLRLALLRLSDSLLHTAFVVLVCAAMKRLAEFQLRVQWHLYMKSYDAQEILMKACGARLNSRQYRRASSESSSANPVKCFERLGGLPRHQPGYPSRWPRSPSPAMAPGDLPTFCLRSKIANTPFNISVRPEEIPAEGAGPPCPSTR
jgi:hypothetical protein